MPAPPPPSPPHDDPRSLCLRRRIVPYFARWDLLCGIRSAATRSSRCARSRSIPNYPTRSRSIPLDPELSHQIPLDPARSRTIPPDPARSHSIPNYPTRSRSIPLDPARSHQIPPDPAIGRWVPSPQERSALVLRMDPHFFAPALPPSPNANNLPYGVFFGAGRHFNGYHVRFRDVARGGLRVVLPASAEAHTAESRRHFNECVSWNRTGCLGS